MNPFFLYIGPGLGGGVIAIVFGLLTSFILFLFAIIWYPIKQLVRKIKSRKKNHF
jgi:hypothetical protein